eukprot:89458-Amphidinium_carterae.1
MHTAICAHARHVHLKEQECYPRAAYNVGPTLQLFDHKVLVLPPEVGAAYWYSRRCTLYCGTGERNFTSGGASGYNGPQAMDKEKILFSKAVSVGPKMVPFHSESVISSSFARPLKDSNQSHVAPNIFLPCSSTSHQLGMI